MTPPLPSDGSGPLPAAFARDRDPLAPSPLKRLAVTITIIGVLFASVYSLAEGTASEKFVQVGFAVGVLVYLLTLVDVLLGIGFLVACIALSPELTLGGVGDLRLEDFLIPALVLSWIGRSMRDRERVIATPLAGPALLYFAAMVLSTGIGVAAGTTAPGRSFAVLLKYAEYYLLFLLVVNNVRSPRDFKAIAVFAVLAAAASALLAGRSVLPGGESLSGRSHGPSGETANIFGGYLVLHLGIACSFLAFSRSVFLKVASFASVALMGTAVLSTLSRTSYASLALALLLVGAILERRLVVLLLIAGILFLAFAPENVSTRAEHLVGVASGDSNPSLDARIAAWEMIVIRLSGIEVFVGKGAGSIPFADADSEYFRVLADTGLLGLALFGWVLLRIGKTAWQLYRSQPRESFGHAYATGFLVAFAAILIHAFAATSFTSIRTMEGFVILCGLMACLHHHREAWSRDDAERDAVPFPGR